MKILELNQYRDRVIQHAVDVFGNRRSAEDWLASANRALGATPNDLLDEADGIARVERVLGRIEHGVFS